MTTPVPTAVPAVPAAAAPVPVVVVRMIPSGSGYGVPHAPAIYAPHQTRDGRWVWRLAERFLLGTVWGKNGKQRERGVYSVAKAERIAAEIAEARGLAVYPASYGRELSPAEIAQFCGGGH